MQPNINSGLWDYEMESVGTLNEEKFLKISSILPIDAKKELIEFLKRNVDLFV